MKKSLLLACALLCAVCTYAKKPRQVATGRPTPADMQKICDSIVAEGNLLYRYEKAAWMGSDIARGNDAVRKEMKNYIVYRDEGDNIRVCIINARGEVILDLAFSGDQQINATRETRPLNEEERVWLETKDTVIKNIFADNETYGVGFPDGFDPNFVLLPHGEGYKLYILAGTSQQDVIPFGNDYIFFADRDGRITGWRKMHSRLLPLQTKIKGETVRETVHSHLPGEPYITPTDICTFRLYGPMYGQKSFIVASTALRKLMTYDIETNSITVIDLPR